MNKNQMLSESESGIPFSFQIRDKPICKRYMLSYSTIKNRSNCASEFRNRLGEMSLQDRKKFLWIFACEKQTNR